MSGGLDFEASLSPSSRRGNRWPIPNIFAKLIARLPTGVLLLTAVALVNLVMGFVRQATIAYYFGTSAELDAFLVAFSLPQLLVGQSAKITVSVMLPVYIGYRQAGKHDEATDLIQRWFWFVGMVAGGLCLLLTLFSNVVVSLIAPGLASEAQINAAQWLRWLLPYVWLMAVAACFKTVLDTNRRFMAPAMAGSIVSITVVAACAIAAPSVGVAVLVPGFVIGGGLAFAIQWIKSRTYEPKLPALPALSSHLKLPVAGAGIMLLNSLATQVNRLIDRSFASTLPEGSIAALHYAQTLNTIPTTVVTSAIATALFPILASMAAHGDWQGTFKTARNWVGFTIVTGLIPVALLILYRTEFVSILFQRGRFDAEAVAMTASVLSVLPFMIILTGSSGILVRLLLSQKAMAILANIAFFAVAFKIILNILLVKRFGLQGLAWATVLVAAVTTVLRYLYAYRYTMSKASDGQS